MSEDFGRRSIGRGRRSSMQPATLPVVGASGDPMGRGRGTGHERHSSHGTPPEGATPKSGTPVDDIIDKTKDMKIIDLIPRPGYGNCGRKIMVYANHFEIRLNKKISVTHYHIDITHDKIKPTPDESRAIFWECVTQHPEIFKDKTHLAFDGQHFLASLDTLPNVPSVVNRPKVEHANVRLLRMESAEPFQVKIQYTSVITVDAQNVQTAAMSDRFTTPLQVLDILFRQRRACLLEENSKNWYPFHNTLYMVPEQGTALGAGRVIWQGLFAASRIGQDHRVFFNFDMSHSGFYKHGITGVEFMIEILNTYFSKNNQFNINQLDEKTQLTDQWAHAINKEMKNLRVRMMVNKPNGQNYERQYTVNGLSKLDANKHQFEKKREDGTLQKVTVTQYFEERYFKLKYPSLNLLHVGNKKFNIFLPLESVRISPYQRVRRLEGNQLNIMIKAAALSAKNRQNKILELVRTSQFQNDPWLRTFDINVNPNMAKLPARILPPMKLKYQNDYVEPREGVWQCRGKKFIIPASCKNISIFVLDRPERYYPLFFNFLLKTCMGFGMQVPPSINESSIKYHNPQLGTKTIEPILKSIAESGAQLIFVVIPLKGSPFYSEVKRVTEILLGVMTQCVCRATVIKTMEKNDLNTAINIALKVNTKLGGVNSLIEMEKSAQAMLQDKPTLVLGIDVTHPAPGERRAPSIAAIVGNLDPTFMRYGASIRVQKHRRESVVYMQDPMRERLVEYFQYTAKQMKTEGGNQPQRIIIYRDGVAEGQFQELLREEINGVREACNQLGEHYKPNLTVIVAQKRHHTRFFPTEGPNEACGKALNVFPGTVVDSMITHPDQFEFYLCSHFGIQGTSRPIRYHVLVDENNFTADQIQMITHYFCHAYARCTRIVSIPAPVYYADLACRRARHHLYEKIQDFGSDTMSQAREESAGIKSSLSEDELVRCSTIHAGMKMRMYFS